MDDVLCDNDAQSTNSSTHEAFTGETIKLSALAASTPSYDFWSDLADAGIRLRPDFVQPDCWVACVMNHQTEAFATREQAASAAVQWLVNESYVQRQTREAFEQKDWGGRLLDLLGALVFLPF